MLTPPPRDANNVVVPHDHAEIANDHRLIRRISELQTVMKDGQRKISTIAYKASDEPNGGMSVDLENLISEAGINAMAWVTSPRWLGSVRFTAGFLREQSFQVGFDPIEGSDSELSNPFHGGVWGSFTKAKQRSLQQAAEWFVQIPGVALS